VLAARLSVLGGLSTIEIGAGSNFNDDFGGRGDRLPRRDCGRYLIALPDADTR
jgi:hypothetical protein